MQMDLVRSSAQQQVSEANAQLEAQAEAAQRRVRFEREDSQHTIAELQSQIDHLMRQSPARPMAGSPLGFLSASSPIEQNASEIANLHDGVSALV